MILSPQAQATADKMFKIVALNAEESPDEKSDDDEAPLITKEAQVN
jgi:hypothetical protein